MKNENWIKTTTSLRLVIFLSMIIISLCNFDLLLVNTIHKKLPIAFFICSASTTFEYPVDPPPLFPPSILFFSLSLNNSSTSAVAMVIWSADCTGLSRPMRLCLFYVCVCFLFAVCVISCELRNTPVSLAVYATTSCRCGYCYYWLREQTWHYNLAQGVRHI